MDQILVGLIGIPAGFLMLKYNYELKQFIGDIDWIEAKFGSGSTYSFLKIMGILTIIVCFLYMVGTLQVMLGDFFAPISPKNIK